MDPYKVLGVRYRTDKQARKTSGDSAALADMEARDRDRPDRAKARTINICVLRSVISKTDISEKV